MGVGSQLVDFAILPDGQVNFFEEFKLQKNCEINLFIKTFLGLVEMIFGLAKILASACPNASYKNDFLCTLGITSYSQ